MTKPTRKLTIDARNLQAGDVLETRVDFIKVHDIEDDSIFFKCTPKNGYSPWCGHKTTNQFLFIEFTAWMRDGRNLLEDEPLEDKAIEHEDLQPDSENYVFRMLKQLKQRVEALEGEK